ncbi:hypothetical protein VaNZ11_010409 [Volvox africanus]|uniref:J domain-containing protein n=1 Tax=Volvox africanus TaxID=51714 RepID=A0ABQ5SAL3_9CHLO|nr:hypothetical protein VaNZ11_010409 [Volvox africanus]
MAADCHQDAPMNELVANILGSGCPYNALGLTTDANLAEVKSAYRRLCLLFHPDKSILPCQLASEIFQVLRKAYGDVIQQQKHIHERSAFDKGDLWCQFFTDAVVSTEAGAYAAPASATGGSLRPTHTPRQGGLWGSARCPVTSAWSRQNVACAPTARAEATAESVDADEAQNEDEPRVEDDPAPIAERKGFGSVDATIPVGKRRRWSTDNSKQHRVLVASSGSSLGGSLQRRGVVVGLEGHFVPRGRGSEPASMKSPGLENTGHIFVQKQAAEDARGERQITPEPSADLMQGPQTGNAWARRPVFSAVVRQASYPSLFAGYQPRNAVSAASMGGDQERLRTFVGHVPACFCTDVDTPDFTSGKGGDDRMTPPFTGDERTCSSSGMEEDIWDVPQTAAQKMAATNICKSGSQPAIGALRNQFPEAAAQPLAGQTKDATMGKRKCTSASAEPEPLRLPVSNDVDVIDNVAYKRRAAQRFSRRDRELVDDMRTGAPSVLLTTVGTAAAQPDSLVSPSFCSATVPCAGMAPLSLGLQPDACDVLKATSAIPSSRFYALRGQRTGLPPSYSLPKCSHVAHVVTQSIATRSLPLKAVDAACPGDGHEGGVGSQQRFEYTKHRKSGQGSAVVCNARRYDEEMSFENDAVRPLSLGGTGECAVGSNGWDESVPECDVPTWEFELNENGEDADADDAWWHEPIAGADDGNRLPDIATERMHRSNGMETGTTHNLEMFLEQVQENGELQAQRVGQARLWNVHRIVMRGRRGKGRRGGASGRRTGGSSTLLGKGVRGNKGTNSILHYVKK